MCLCLLINRLLIYFNQHDIMHPVKAMLYYIKKHNIKQPIFSLCSAFGNDKLRNGGIDVRTLVCIINKGIYGLDRLF